MKKKRPHLTATYPRIKSLWLTLESGTKRQFDIHRDTSIPDNPKAIWKAAQKAPRRYLFWRHQLERARRVVRDCEENVTLVVGRTTVKVRTELDADGRDFINPSRYGVVSSFVDVASVVVEARKHLREAKNQCGMIQAVCDAMEHRLYILRKKLSGDQTDPRD